MTRPDRLRARDVTAERLTCGGWLLAAMHDGRRVKGRYFEYSLREARGRFVADVNGGMV